MSDFRDGPPAFTSNAMLDGPARERLAREFEAAQRERIAGRATEQKAARDLYYSTRRRITETPT